MTAPGEWGNPSKETAPEGYFWSLESPDYGTGPAVGNALGYKLRPISYKPPQQLLTSEFLVDTPTSKLVRDLSYNPILKPSLKLSEEFRQAKDDYVKFSERVARMNDPIKQDRMLDKWFTKHPTQTDPRVTIPPTTWAVPKKTYRNFEVPPGQSPTHILPEQANNPTSPGGYGWALVQTPWGATDVPLDKNGKPIMPTEPTPFTGGRRKSSPMPGENWGEKGYFGNRESPPTYWDPTNGRPPTPPQGTSDPTIPHILPEQANKQTTPILPTQNKPTPNILINWVYGRMPDINPYPSKNIGPRAPPRISPVLTGTTIGKYGGKKSKTPKDKKKLVTFYGI